MTGLQAKLIGALAIALLVAGLLLNRNYWRGRAHKDEAQIVAFQQTITDIRAKTAKAQADDAAHAKAVETTNTNIGKESSNEYQARLAAVRADYAERLRRATAEANSRRSRDPSVSGVTTAAKGLSPAPEENQLPPADALVATEQAIQLDSILQWGKKVGIIR